MENILLQGILTERLDMLEFYKVIQVLLSLNVFGYQIIIYGQFVQDFQVIIIVKVLLLIHG